MVDDSYSVIMQRESLISTYKFYALCTMIIFTLGLGTKTKIGLLGKKSEWIKKEKALGSWEKGLKMERDVEKMIYWLLISLEKRFLYACVHACLLREEKKGKFMEIEREMQLGERREVLTFMPHIVHCARMTCLSLNLILLIWNPNSHLYLMDN